MTLTRDLTLMDLLITIRGNREKSVYRIPPFVACLSAIRSTMPNANPFVLSPRNAEMPKRLSQYPFGDCQFFACDANENWVPLSALTHDTATTWVAWQKGNKGGLQDMTKRIAATFAVAVEVAVVNPVQRKVARLNALPKVQKAADAVAA